MYRRWFTLLLTTLMFALTFSSTIAPAQDRPARTDLTTQNSRVPLGSMATRLPGTLMPAMVPDNDIPGVALPSSPALGTLDPASDVLDVFQVPLVAGQTIYIELTGSAGTDFDLWMFRPSTPSVSTASNEDYVGWSAGAGTSSEALMFTASETGTYYLDVEAYPGTAAGEYVLTYGYPTDQPTVSMSVSKTSLSYGGSTTITGVVRDQASAPVSNGWVVLWAREYGSSSWTIIDDATTGPLGEYAFVAKPKIKTLYAVDFYGDFTHLDAAGPSRYVSVKGWVSRPNAPAVMLKTKSYSVYGYLKPRHKSGTYCVRIYKWRWNGKRWVSKGYTTAKASNYSSYSKYSRSIKLTTAGKWRLRAYHSDAGHLGAWSSSYEYVKVK